MIGTIALELPDSHPHLHQRIKALRDVATTSLATRLKADGVSPTVVVGADHANTEDHLTHLQTAKRESLVRTICYTTAAFVFAIVAAVLFARLTGGLSTQHPGPSEVIYGFGLVSVALSTWSIYLAIRQQRLNADSRAALEQMLVKQAGRLVALAPNGVYRISVPFNWPEIEFTHIADIDELRPVTRDVDGRSFSSLVAVGLDGYLLFEVDLFDEATSRTVTAMFTELQIAYDPEGSIHA